MSDEGPATHASVVHTNISMRMRVCVFVRPHFKSACRGLASGVSTQVFCGHFAPHFSARVRGIVRWVFVSSFRATYSFVRHFNFHVRIFSYSVFLTTYVSSPFSAFGLQLFSQFQLSFNVLNVIIIRFLKVSWDNASRILIQTHVYCISAYGIIALRVCCCVLKLATSAWLIGLLR